MQAPDNNIVPKFKTITIEMQYNKNRVQAECQVCQKTDWEVIDHICPPIIDSHLVICKNCGFVSRNPQLKDLVGYYARNKRRQSIGFLSTKKNKLNFHRSILFEYLDEKFKEKHNVPFKILDYGCSDGYLLKALDNECPEVLDLKGIEPNSLHTNWGKYIDDLDITDSIDLDDYKNLDLIIMYHVIEHVQELRKFLIEIRSKLKDGGLLYLALPTITKISYTNEKELFKDEHINFFTDELLYDFIESLGFVIKKKNTNLYGTAIIAEKSEAEKVLKSHYGEIKQHLESVGKMYKLKAQMETLMKRGNIEQAKQVAKAALNEYDLFPEMICKHASLYDVIDEQDILKDYIKKYPDMWELRQQLALCYYKDTELKKCIETFDELEKIAGESNVGLLHKSRCYYYIEDYKKALIAVKKAVERDRYDMQIVEWLITIVSSL